MPFVGYHVNYQHAHKCNLIYYTICMVQFTISNSVQTSMSVTVSVRKCCEGKEVLLEIEYPVKLENLNFATLELKLEYSTHLNVQMAVCNIKKAHSFVYCSDISFSCTVVL